MGSEQHYSLRWNDYTVKIVTAFQSLRDEEDFVDVTVACDGHSYSAHKMVLSACSPYFRTLLRANPCQHPIVILKDVGHVELERLLEFMYNGEVSIAQDQLAAFLKTAENLKIRGLAGSSDEMDAGVHRPDVSYSYSGVGGMTSDRSSPSAGYAPSQGSKDDEMLCEGYHRTDSPPPKRRKRSSAPAATTAAAAGHPDSTPTAEGVGDSSVEVEGGTLGGGGGGVLSSEDDVRLDRRELKSEPAMPGPSGSAGQDGSIPHEPGVAQGGAGAVCEALNLSLRPPLLPQQQQQQHHHHHHHHNHNHHHHQQDNGPTTIQQPQQHHLHHGNTQHHLQLHHLHHQPPPPPPPPPQIQPQPGIVHHHHPQHQQHPQHHHMHHSGPPTPQEIITEDNGEEFEVKVHPSIAASGGVGGSVMYGEDVMNLAPDKVVGMMNLAEPKEEQGLIDTMPEYKPKQYPCPECQKVFRHPMSLHHHRHVHKGTYTCHSCGKVFSRRWDLHRHLHRSKMGCRRPNHHNTTTSPPLPPAPTPAPLPITTTATTNTAGVMVAGERRAEYGVTLNINDTPSN